MAMGGSDAAAKSGALPAQKALNEQNGFSLQGCKQSRDRSVATAASKSSARTTSPRQNRFTEGHRARLITRLERGLRATAAAEASASASCREASVVAEGAAGDEEESVHD